MHLQVLLLSQADVEPNGWDTPEWAATAPEFEQVRCDCRHVGHRGPPALHCIARRTSERMVVLLRRMVGSRQWLISLGHGPIKRRV